jgi:hypothetical protein
MRKPKAQPKYIVYKTPLNISVFQKDRRKWLKKQKQKLRIYRRDLKCVSVFIDIRKIIVAG